MAAKILAQLKEPMARQIKERGLNLVSEIDMDDGDIELIRSNGARMYCALDNGRSGILQFDIQFAYYLVDIGIRYYDAKTYWKNFWESIGCNPDVNKQAMVGKCFLETLDRYGLSPISDDSSRKYVGSIMAHAFIPECYSQSFFDFIYRFYSIVLRGSVPDDFFESMEVISNVFTDPSYAKKFRELSTFNIIKSMKDVFSDPTLFCTIVEKIIRRMANAYDDPGDVGLGVYEEQFKRWAEGRSSGIGVSKINSSPYIEMFDRDRARFCIIVPQRVSKRGRVRVTVVSPEGEELYAKDIECSEEFGIHLSNELRIPMEWSPLEPFFVCFDGQKALSSVNEGFLLLNKNGRAHKKVSLGFNMAVLSNGMEEPPGFFELGGRDGWTLYGFMMKSGDAILLGGRRFSVEKTVDESIHITSSPIDVECRDSDGNPYFVFIDPPVFRITVNRSNAPSSFELVNGINRMRVERLSDLCGDRIGSNESRDVILDPSEHGLECREGLYTLKFGGRVLFNYLLVPGFGYEFEEPFYSENKVSSYRLWGSNELIEFDTSVGTVVTEPRTIDGRKLTFSIQVPSRRYQLDNRPWRVFGDELYFRDARASVLRVYTPDMEFPKIKVAGQKKDFPLAVEGRNLTFDFSRIAMLAKAIEMSEDDISALTFEVGGNRIFTIRYSADYNRSGDRVEVSNIPANVRPVLVGERSRKIADIDGPSFMLPSGTEDLYVEEIYSDGFSEESRRVYSVRRSFVVNDRSSIGSIQSGERYGIFVVHGREDIRCQAKDFQQLISLEDCYSRTEEESCRDSLEAGSKQSLYYAEIRRAVRDVLVADKNPVRLCKRAVRFADGDPEFAAELYRRYIDITGDESAKPLLDSIQARLDDYRLEHPSDSYES